MKLNLKDLVVTGEKSLRADVSYSVAGLDSPILFSLAYLDKPTFSSLSDSCFTTEFDKKTHQPNRKLNQEMLRGKLVQRCMMGWKNLKFRDLPFLIPVSLEILKAQVEANSMTLDHEVPYTEELMIQLLSLSYGLEPWFMDAIMNLAHFQDVEKITEQAKN